MIASVTRAEWTVLDNAAHAREHTHGFQIAPVNLNAIMVKLQHLGLIEKGNGTLYYLTARGRTAHAQAARRYAALK